MISLKVEVRQIYINEGSDTCIKAYPVNYNGQELVKHNQWRTISIYGKFPDFLKEKEIYIISISDHASDKGHYRLVDMGRLPRKETLENLRLLVMENPNKTKDEDSASYYPTLIFNVEHLYSKEEDVILKYLEKNENLELDDYTNTVLNKHSALIRELKVIYDKAKDIVLLREGLCNMGVTDENTHFKIVRNIKTDYNEALKALQENPYLLIDMAEMNLDIVDDIALAIGIKADDDNRISAITEMNLRRFGADGKTWLTKESYLVEHKEFYSYDTNDYIFSKSYLLERIDKLGDRAGFYVNVDFDRIASSKYFLMEQELFGIINKLCTHESLAIPLNTIKKAIVSCEKTGKFKLLKEQDNAVYNSFKCDLSVIAGAAGTGKTTISQAISNAYQNILVTALSGKATLRISETTGVSGEKSRTMHSFSSTDKQYLDAELIIVDEVSMVGLDIAIDFFKKIRPGTHVLLLGDHCQLSPIGAGNFFSDLLHSNFINVSIIEEVHRQALDSNIIQFATNVRHQICDENILRNVILNDFEMHLVANNRDMANIAIKSFIKYMNSYSIEDIMLVSPTKNAAFVLNNSIQSIRSKQKIVGPDIIELNAQWDKELKFVLCENDRVINVENYHSCPTNQEGTTISVMNGSLGTFIGKKEIKNKKGKVIRTIYEIAFDGLGIAWFSENELRKRILLGYCITVHKSQGSQAKLVIYIHPERCHDRLNCSEMVYTAVTRAKEKAIVISTESTLEKAITTQELSSKQTLLKEFLDADYKPSAKTSANEKYKTFEEDKPSKETKGIDSKTRTRYDKNNAQKRAKRRNENGLLAKEQAKLEKVNLIKKLYNEGKTQKEIVEITGFTKGTVSRYLRL